MGQKTEQNEMANKSHTSFFYVINLLLSGLGWKQEWHYLCHEQNSGCEDGRIYEFFSSWLKIKDSRLVELSERSVKRDFDLKKIKIQIMLLFYALVADIKPLLGRHYR